MDQLEDTIEQYKRALMQYAKENGRNYAAGNEPQAKKNEEREPKQPQVEEKAEEDIPVWKKYKKNRPMPVEYEGEKAAEESKAVLPGKPESDELTQGVEREYGSFEEFERENPARGMLRIQAFAAQQAFPVVNAKIEVEKEFEDGTHTFAEAYTDINGVVENITLPTKDKSLSQAPGGVIPYTTYTVKVSHPHFAPIVFCEVPIFDGIESLQPVAMVQAGKKDVTNE